MLRSQFFRLWLQTSGRHWRTHRLQSATLIAILALGVASYLSIRMANRAAIRGFSGFTTMITGQSDFQLLAAGDRFAVEWLQTVRESVQHYPVELAPLKELPALLLDAKDEDGTTAPFEQSPVSELRIVGVDIVGIQNLNDRETNSSLIQLDDPGEQIDLFDIIRQPLSVFLSPRVTENRGLKPGDTIPVLIGDQRVRLIIRGILPTNRSGVDVPENLAIMDLPAVMELSGSGNTISRVEVVVESAEKNPVLLDAIYAKLKEASGGRWEVIRGNESNQTGAEMTSAFRLNLTILSFISLLVGLYLITQSMDAAVIQRRREIGILRAMGLLPGEIRSLWLMDLLAFGLAGSLFGIFLGWVAAQSVVIAIARTVNALYMTTTAASAQLTSMDWVLGLLLGVAGSLLAGGFPLRVATKTEPAKILASGRQELAREKFRYHRLGLLLLVAGVAFSLLPPVAFHSTQEFPAFGYLAAICWLLGGALSVAGLIAPMGKSLHRGFSGHLVQNLGFGKLRLPGGRHRLAVSGLFVAIGMAASMSILIGSFETTVVQWLKTRFQADVYLASRAFTGASSQHFIRSPTLAQIRGEPSVEAVSTYRFLSITFRDRPTYLVGFTSASLEEGREKFLWIQKPLLLHNMPAEADTWAIINETFSYRYKVDVPGILNLETPAGTKKIWLRGIQADYGNDRGSLMVDKEYLKSWYGVEDYSNATLYLKPGSDTNRIIESLRSRYPDLDIRGQSSLLQNALQVFRETFAVTYALKVLGLFVAVIGLALALLNILREDVYSLRTLHSMGLRRREIAGVTACEGFGLTLVASVGGLILSFALGWLLIFVINRQSFGWTLQYRIPWMDLAAQTMLLLLSGSIVSWMVGWFSGQQKPLQEE